MPGTSTGAVIEVKPVWQAWCWRIYAIAGPAIFSTAAQRALANQDSRLWARLAILAPFLLLPAAVAAFTLRVFRFDLPRDEIDAIEIGAGFMGYMSIVRHHSPELKDPIQPPNRVAKIMGSYYPESPCSAAILFSWSKMDVPWGSSVSCTVFVVDLRGVVANRARARGDVTRAATDAVAPWDIFPSPQP